MNKQSQTIVSWLTDFYPQGQWPSLLKQAEEWAETQPLKGLRILDATPLYRNTLAKFVPLLAAGAELYLAEKPAMPHDKKMLAQAVKFGIPAVHPRKQEFDIILDCAGSYHKLQPTLGYCELTRSGAARYEHSSRPVFLADAGKIKRLETILGTGDGFFRAMTQLGHRPRPGASLVIVGYGKVGHGIAYYASKHKLKLTIADISENAAGDIPEGARFINVRDREQFNDLVMNSWCLVSCTGKFGALQSCLNLPALHHSPVLLANMGIEDEFGEKIASTRVLNGKAPVNFVLEEPTTMRYIETTMALHNACALELLTADLPHNTLLPPPPDVEARLLKHCPLTAEELAVCGL